MIKYCYYCFLLLFLISCGKDSKSEQQEYITIGALFPLTGEFCNEGIRALSGLQLARQVINENGGILGKRLDIITLDDKNDIQHALEQYEVLKEKGVVAIIGSSFPEVTQALIEATEKDGMPIVSPTFASPAESKALASFAYNVLGARTALIIDNTNNNRNDSISKIFEEEFKIKNGKILAHEHYLTPKDFEIILEKYKSNQPDVIFCPTNYIFASKLVKTAHKLGLDKSKFVGTYSWEGILSFLHGYEVSNRIYYASVFVPSNDDPKIKEFSQNFFESFSQMPISASALSYSSVQTLVAAIESSGSTKAKDIIEAVSTNVPDVIATHNTQTVYIMQIENNLYSLFEKISL